MIYGQEKNITTYNLNISRYVGTAEPEPQIDLSATHAQSDLDFAVR